jgi:hypothetical protein
MTKEEIKAMAQKTAEEMVKRAVAGYVKTCDEWAETYIENGDKPDEADFFAWMEGFDWSKQD